MKKRIGSVLLAISLVMSLLVFVSPTANAATTIYAFDVITEAKKMIGCSYVWGGSDPRPKEDGGDGGVDCSGLIYYVFHTRLHHPMTRNQAASRSQLAKFGTQITDKSQLLPGDIVVYSGHEGIYSGNNKIIHAANKKLGVKQSPLDKAASNFLYGVRLNGMVMDVGGTQTATKPSNDRSIVSLNHGEWIVTAPANQKLLLYRDETSTNSATYVRAQSTAYPIVCTQKVVLSNGETRYCGLFNKSKDNYWLIFSSDMTVEDRNNATCTITFDPNGGYVEQTTQVIEKGSDPRNLPIPVRDGYIFHGWSFDKIDPYFTETFISRIASENSAWGFEEDTTLYAYWIPCTNHEKGSYLRCEINHPHYNYYTCSICGASFTDGSTSNVESCKECNPDQSGSESVGHWGDWSDWSTASVFETSTRQVQTQQVEISSERTEYRYGRYAYTDYRLHTCWCQTYMTKLFGSATLQYSDWSTTRYSPTGKVWTCGNCRGNHIGVDHYSKGKPCWAEYSLPDGDYFWEESRTVSAQQETQYRYRDWIND